MKEIATALAFVGGIAAVLIGMATAEKFQKKWLGFLVWFIILVVVVIGCSLLSGCQQADAIHRKYVNGELVEEIKISFDNLGTSAWREDVKIWLPFITVDIESSIIESEPIAPMVEAGAEGAVKGLVGKPIGWHSQDKGYFHYDGKCYCAGKITPLMRGSSKLWRGGNRDWRNGI